jgi:hypothetical protein
MEKTAMGQQGASEKALRRWTELQTEIRICSSSLRAARESLRADEQGM